MKTDASSLLEKARHAYGRRAWADAFELLQATDEIAPLGPEDLERLLWSAGMLDRDEDTFATGARLFNLHIEEGLATGRRIGHSSAASGLWHWARKATQRP